MDLKEYYSVFVRCSDTYVFNCLGRDEFNFAACDKYEVPAWQAAHLFH